jgi:periplasmic divalent cation tolerance protein
MAGLPLLVITTLGTREQALALAHDLVERRLAACAQITAIDSVYRWQGAVAHEGEFRLLLKTRADGYAALEQAIRARHPYELPAIHAVAVAQAYEPYAQWVEASTRPESAAD